MTRFAAMGFLLATNLAACALPSTTPPFNLTRTASVAPAPAPAAVASLPIPRTFRHHARIAQAYDRPTDQTRISLVTHRGLHFLWLERPRITFFTSTQEPRPGTHRRVSSWSSEPWTL